MYNSILSRYRTELMGCTILFVLIGHIITLGGLVDTMGGKIVLFIWSFLPVEGFLFLSGYGMMYSLRKNDDIILFYKRRFYRFLLPFWCLGIPFFLLIVIAEHKDIWFFITSITTAKFWISGNYYGMWYVAITLFLYLITPPVYAVVKKCKNWAWLFILVVLLLFYLIGFAIQTKYKAYWELTSIGIARIPYYFMGMLFAYFDYRNVDDKNDKTLVSNKHVLGFLGIIIVFYLVFLSFGYTEANFHMGAVMLTIGLVVMSLIFSFSAKYNIIIYNSMKWMGKYTYELYLLHLYIWFIIRNTLHLGMWQNIALACVCAIILAYPVNIVVNWICNKIQATISK